MYSPLVTSPDFTIEVPQLPHTSPLTDTCLPHTTKSNGDPRCAPTIQGRYPRCGSSKHGECDTRGLATRRVSGRSAASRVSAYQALGPNSNAGEGRGASRPSSPTAAASPPPDTPSFAPRGPSTLQSRIRDKLPKPLRLHERHGSIARIHTACSVCP